MADGTRYSATKRGKVEIENPRHVRDFKNNVTSVTEGIGASEAISGVVTGFYGHDTENLCIRCSFSLFNWQHECPRCGQEA